jgi:DNA-binding MarR family transcriptional regulator
VSTTTSAVRSALIAQLARLGEQESTGTALFHQAAAASYGVGVVDMKALSILLAEGPQSAGSLGAAIGLTSGAVTGLVDRLIAHGMATRSNDPADRRRILISADPAVIEGDNVYLSIGAAFSALHSGYTTEELEFLVRYLTASIEITRQETAALKRRPRKSKSRNRNDTT